MIQYISPKGNIFQKKTKEREKKLILYSKLINHSTSFNYILNNYFKFP